MKSFFKASVFCLTLALVGSMFTSCKNKSAEKTEQTDETGIEYSSLYVCPMHCEGSGSDEPGKCPVCNMDYVLNEDAVDPHKEEMHEGHDHDHNHDEESDDHEGHDHG